MTDYEIELLVTRITKAVVEAMRGPVPAILKPHEPVPQVFNYQREKNKPGPHGKYRG